ncbi:hypothetical protein G7047_25735 [Diaphorobacter sp. HDW4A]|uniref:hypothetical protein n=1 Tax=Diaphorobacter sp. HDW4A TaxID=2714924 RepID=UPI00140C3D31|nr:hypothetical protein [Diaphorobacter sp. HDW4A]QIL82960.1 hypothetical protein G7047_25735 [Diaphorobacter sp. HDW4A]
MKKNRAPDLTPQQIEAALDTLDTWRGKLTWELLLDKLEEQWGSRYSRFTLSSYEQVALAFSNRKNSLSGTLPKSRGVPADARLRAALEQTERLKAKAGRLEVENARLLEQFVTWAHNAERKGVTMDMLNAPLPKPDRDRSKGVA